MNPLNVLLFVLTMIAIIGMAVYVRSIYNEIEEAKHETSRLVLYYGEIWQMSDRSYARMLRAVANGQESPTFQELRARKIGRLTLDVTDLSKSEAEFYLNSDVR